MLKTLLKKQLMETNTWLIQNKKTGKNRSTGGVVGLAVVYIVLFAFLGVFFYLLSSAACLTLVSMDLGWLYFTLMSMIAILLGVFGSVFTTYSSLYLAKDNEMLLSMPIKPSNILFARLFSVWLWSIIYEMIVLVPALISYWQIAGLFGKLTVGAVIGGILLLLLVSAFVIVLTCVLGWFVAKISTKLKNKSFVVVLLSLAFFALYYWGYSKIYDLLQSFLDNAQLIGDKISAKILPLYWLGRCGEGDFVSILLTAVIVLGLLALTCFVLSRTFIKIATSSGTVAKKKYKNKKMTVSSVSFAMFKKELHRFTSSANYMLNCGLGVIMLPIAGIAALAFASDIREIIEWGLPVDMLTPIACIMLCFLSAMIDITAPSVSLEGKNIWIAQSMPINPWTALKAKLTLHMLISEVSMLICSVCLIIALRLSVIGAVMLLVIPTLFIVVMAEFGLFLNLKSPNLTWSSEIVPIKQSLSVTISLIGGWVFVGLLFALGFGISIMLGVNVAMIIVAVILLIIAFVMYKWLKTGGARIFAQL